MLFYGTYPDGTTIVTGLADVGNIDLVMAIISGFL